MKGIPGTGGWRLRLPRLTITQRLWIGLGLTLGLFLAADLVSLRATHVLDATLSSLVHDAERRSAAAYEMKVALADLSRGVQGYLQERSATQRNLAKAGQTGFERALQRYRELGSTEHSRGLGEQALERYSRYQAQADMLVGLKDAQGARLLAYDAHKRRGPDLLRDMPPVDWPARQSPPMDKRMAAQALATELVATSRNLEHRLKNRPAAMEAALRAEERMVAASLDRYRAQADSAGQREWVARASQWVAEGSGQAAAIMRAERVQRQALAELIGLRGALEQLLDEGIQPAARAELTAAMDRASGTAHEANVLITRGLLLALLLGVVVAVATGRAVKAPLRELVASSRRLAEGDFSYRAPSHGRDELGELTSAFNEMAGKLQATTVSRRYMESIVNSMGEALLVISQGRIKTANPAAERLLGYHPGGLAGRDVGSIVAAGGGAWAQSGASLPPHTADATSLRAELLRESAEPLRASAELLRASAEPLRASAELLTRSGEPVPVAISAVPMQAGAGMEAAMVCVAQDLRAGIAAEREQRQASVVFDNTREGIILADAQRSIVLVNPAFTDITGYEASEVEGRLARLLWSKRHDSAFCAALWESVERHGQWQGEIWMRRKGGELRPVWKNISVVRDAAGNIVNHVLVFSDISAIKDAEERLHYLAYHDPLTDLPNRMLLSDRLRTALSEAERSQTSVALLYVDLDNFKNVNDTLGHEVGDRLLQTMAARLRSCVRGKDGVARHGGDEFIVILQDVDDVTQAARVAEKVIAAVSAPVELSGLELRMRASIGISLGPKHGSTGEELLKAADAALHRAKQGGRGRYEFFSAELTRLARERLTLETALRHPRLPEQLVLHYQPQVSIPTGRIVGVEALVRWQHPVRGLLAPNHFIPVAEEAGLIHVVGEWVLQTACSQAKAWLDLGHAPIRMAVNVSALEITSHRIVQSVEAVLRETALAPSLLELEVTEGAVQTGEGATAVLGRLQALGVRLALDDFGTGYSALSSLKLLPFDRLKIDRSFVQDLEQEANGRALVKAIVAMARSLDLDIVAEGVETPAQLAFLREEGCDEMQGYLIGKPMTAAEIESRLQAQASGAADSRNSALAPGRQAAG
jgi:diguanylate cyclase (GGDEF)-like protein/PAS domain S-box-containing protein